MKIRKSFSSTKYEVSVDSLSGTFVIIDKQTEFETSRYYEDKSYKTFKAEFRKGVLNFNTFVRKNCHFAPSKRAMDKRTLEKTAKKLLKDTKFIETLNKMADEMHMHELEYKHQGLLETVIQQLEELV